MMKQNTRLIFRFLPIVLACFVTSSVSAAVLVDTRTEQAVETLFHSTPGETRALIVLKDGQPVIKRYAPGYSDKNRFISWSMAKSVTASAVGILVADGKLSLDAPAPVAAWHTKTGDPRAAITLRHLLNMSSGLQHEELGNPVEKADTVNILFAHGAENAAAAAEAKPLSSRPGSVWQYSTATSVILADIVTRAITLETDPQKKCSAIRAWFDTRLFSPAGISTAVWECDRAGTFLGGSFLHMSAPDWAWFGEMYRNNGASNGKQVIPAEWIKFERTPAPAHNNGHYGAHFWLNFAPKPTQRPALFYPRGARDIYAMLGHVGQYVIISPSQHIVIVRLGQTSDGDLNAIRTALSELADTFPAVDHP